MSKVLVYLDEYHLTQVYKHGKAQNLVETYKRTLSVEYKGRWQENVFVIETESLEDSLDLSRSIYIYINSETDKLSIKHPFRACVCSHLDYVIPGEPIINIYKYITGTMFIYTTKNSIPRKNEYLLTCPIKHLGGEEVDGSIVLPKSVIPRYLVIRPGKSENDLITALASGISWDNFALTCSFCNEYKNYESDSVAIAVLYDVNYKSPVIQHAVNLYNCGFDKISSTILSHSIPTSSETPSVYVDGLAYKTFVFESSPVSPLIKTNEPRSLHYILKPSTKMRELAKIISCK